MLTEHDPISLRSIDNVTCFLCGSNEEIGKEHVFPKWLQHRHNLWNRKLVLQNNTMIDYKHLVIPCCRSCNNEHLARLEDRVKTAVEEGYDSCMNLTPLEIMQWVGKMYFGILKKELTLVSDRANDSNESILDVSLIDNYRVLHLMLQSIRTAVSMQSAENRIFSVHVANLLSDEIEAEFDFRDSTNLLVAGIRLGSVGFIVAFHDAGLTHDTYGQYLTDVGGRKLHPSQFKELYAKVLYQNSLLNRSPKFLSSVPLNPEGPISLTMLPLAWLSQLPVIGDWNQEDYAHTLAFLLGYGEDVLEDPSFFSKPSLVRTWMTDQRGR
tara:strand:+ start:2139 stop:3110 length:972 start_codon:yes stop_codon:yes gene_type:complete